MDALKEDEFAPSVIFQRLTGGAGGEPERLKDIARDWGLPRGRLIEWFTTEHKVLYETALRVRAGELVLEALEIADGAKPETVRVEALRVKTRLDIASSWDRETYGQPLGGVHVNVNAPGSLVNLLSGLGVRAIEALAAPAEERVVSEQAPQSEQSTGEEI